jgi:DNA (cytosine-5)-methyltransferase 1
VRYYFPKPFPLERRLKDVLEENVDEKYYLSDEMLERFRNEKVCEHPSAEPQDGMEMQTE